MNKDDIESKLNDIEIGARSAKKALEDEDWTGLAMILQEIKNSCDDIDF